MKKHEDHVTAYFKIYDSTWCLSCNMWIEEICDADCSMCSVRPKKVEIVLCE